jgi:hypothetical protein
LTLSLSACGISQAESLQERCAFNCQFVEDTCGESPDFDVILCTEDCSRRQHTEESLMEFQACTECYVSFAGCRPILLYQYCQGACGF